jgi:hypothetical protein
MAASYKARASGVGSIHPEKAPGSFFDALIEVSSAGADYPAGGYAFGIAQLQTLFGGAYSAIESVEVVNPWVAVAGGGTTCFVASFDKVNNKVQAFGMGASAVVGVALVEATTNDAALAAGMTCTLRVRFY